MYNFCSCTKFTVGRPHYLKHGVSQPEGNLCVYSQPVVLCLLLCVIFTKKKTIISQMSFAEIKETTWEGTLGCLNLMLESRCLMGLKNLPHTVKEMQVCT